MQLLELANNARWTSLPSIILLILQFRQIFILPSQKAFKRFFCFAPPPPRKLWLFSYIASTHLAFKSPLPLGISSGLPWGGYRFFLEPYYTLSNHDCLCFELELLQKTKFWYHLAKMMLNDECYLICRFTRYDVLALCLAIFIPVTAIVLTMVAVLPSLGAPPLPSFKEPTKVSELNYITRPMIMDTKSWNTVLRMSIHLHL